MYVIGISGSPRKEGNTALLVKEVLRHIKGQKRFISLADLDIHPCNSCDRCWKENIECVIEDDILWILREMEKCDAMILGSPCCFGSVSAQLKMLMDRTLSLSQRCIKKQDRRGGGNARRLRKRARRRTGSPYNRAVL